MPFSREFVAAPNLGEPNAGKVDRRTLAAMHFFTTRVMILNPANANRKIAGLDFDRITNVQRAAADASGCLLYTSPSPRDQRGSRMPSSA